MTTPIPTGNGDKIYQFDDGTEIVLNDDHYKELVTGDEEYQEAISNQKIQKEKYKTVKQELEEIKGENNNKRSRIEDARAKLEDLLQKDIEKRTDEEIQNILDRLDI